MKKLAFFISTLCYAGYFPKAPGTFGSLVSLPVIFVINYNFGFTGLFLVTVIVFFISIFAVKKVLSYTEHDPSFVVVDEFIGQAVTFFLMAEKLKHSKSVIPYIVGFILFRLFDITKPFPVSYADKKMKNAAGVILDDIFAGIYAAIILYFITYFVKGL
ncbi:phosphatidylglycerophosphatase A family protein [Candidatus Ruminimicrobiellum ovillum]|uniref:phosphatidylglycerophosphatase A family protein n=1 Tax=Candidatus Ruminimicrobiellum ovillum TaxID=1947927 RepID=UPI00355A0E02